MDTESFLRAYGESRNGANDFYRHTMWRKLVYSDGVKECLETGVYWLMDVIGTECVKPVLDSGLPLGILYVNVNDGKADLRIEMQDDVVLWKKRVEYTDMPDGEWTFYLANDGDTRQISAILPTEY